MKNVSNQYYDHAWEMWDDMKTYGPASRHVRRIIINWIKDLELSTVLDAGCGAGTLISALMAKFPDAKYTGTDISRAGVEKAQEKVPSAEFIILNLEKYHLSSTFDLVLCIDVLEHIEDDIQAIQNLRKMTGKYLLVVVPTGPLFEKEKINVGHVHGYKVGEVVQKLEQTGFFIRRKISWGFPFYNIYRRLVMNLPTTSVSGKYTLMKKMASALLYILLFFNLPFWGERLFILCENKNV